MASSLPSGETPQLQKHFHVAEDAQLVLPNSIFLVGYVLGPFVFAPLTETLGRRFIIVGTFLVFTIFMTATALAPNWPAFIIFRLLSGLFGSTPIAVTSGLYADVLDNPVHRGRSVAWFMAVASCGPGIGPIASGYLAQFYGWRWPFWFALICAGTCAVPLLFLPETFGPAILASRARAIRKKNPGSNVYSPLELKKVPLRLFFSTVLGRPLRMMITEPIVAACCLYLSLIYAVFFIFLQSFYQIYEPVYGFSQGETGLAFLAFIIGSLLAMPICFVWDHTLFTAKRRNKPWSAKSEYQRLPLAFIGGPLFTAGIFWIGWGARRSVHWIVPMLGGIPLGIGFVLIFVALANYLVDAYRIYSASAMGAASISRSTFGVVLPFAAKPMYRTLGIAWACSLLGFLALVMCVIPFIFVKYGDRLRSQSPMCLELAKQDLETRRAQDSEVPTPADSQEGQGDAEQDEKEKV